MHDGHVVRSNRGYCMIMVCLDLCCYYCSSSDMGYRQDIGDCSKIVYFSTILLFAWFIAHWWFSYRPIIFNLWRMRRKEWPSLQFSLMELSSCHPNTKALGRFWTVRTSCWVTSWCHFPWRNSSKMY